MDDLNRFLSELGGADTSLAALIPRLYDELRALAARTRKRAGGSAASTTSIVHEAYERLAQQRSVDWVSRGQFFHLAARAMRSLVVDRARREQAARHGGGALRIELDAIESEAGAMPADEVLAIDQALAALAGVDPRAHDVVVCRVFGGLDVDATAIALGCASATVKRDYAFARIWLYQQLGGPG
ncbi:MAG: RNA polymerase subunit sigma [Xanthomonadales bacterium]|nr:RNA polymerase subunit sigma [Xanthomonadales bacterium]